MAVSMFERSLLYFPVTHVTGIETRVTPPNKATDNTTPSFIPKGHGLHYPFLAPRTKLKMAVPELNACQTYQQLV